jgi:hypothetical protein
MRDQAFISGVSRTVEEEGKKLVKGKLVPNARGRTDEERLDERTDKEELLVRRAREEGVEIVLMPKGMSRRGRNASRWDSKFVFNLDTIPYYLLTSTSVAGTRRWNGRQKSSSILRPLLPSSLS